VRLLAYVNVSMNQELLLQNEYLAAENPIRSARPGQEVLSLVPVGASRGWRETDHAPGQESESERVCRALGSAPHEYFGTMGTSRPRDMWAHLSGSDQFRIRSGRTVDGRDGAHP
jgi:hypothetical protein